MFQELGFFGGKTVLRKQFGEAVDDDEDSMKPAQASAASAWKDKKVICNNPYCKVHGYGRQLDKASDTQMSDMHNSGGQYKSYVSNAYGVTDDLSMDIDDSVPASISKSKVSTDDAVDPIENVLKPRRQSTNQHR